MVCAVIKANAYGYGSTNIVEAIQDLVDYFAVARVDELESLRKFKRQGKVLVLSPLKKEIDIRKVIMLNADITVDNIDELLKIESIAKNLNKKANIHIKVDTGMNRYGIKDIAYFERLIKICKRLKYINIIGLYSHFACSNNKDICNEQKMLFDNYKKIINEFDIYPICHIASSKASVKKEYLFDMVRIGIDLYESNATFRGNVIAVKNINKGERIGYEYSFTATENMRIAIVDIGYGDVSIRKLSNKGQVLVDGEPCRIVGNICMDCMFIDVTNLNGKSIKKAVLFGKQGKSSISICDIAKSCDTISYEILTSISNRVKRELVYANNNR